MFEGEVNDALRVVYETYGGHPFIFFHFHLYTRLL
jgi:hypothetical protein